ncbi:jg23122, partial [Pararge aegeria aegeria]
VLSYNTDQEVLRALEKQNKTIFKDLEEDREKLEICFRKKTRNPHANHIVLRVPPRIWQRMTGAEAVHIDLQRVRVVDHSPLVQCSLCLGYGHNRKLCKDTTTKCSHCGGPHIKADCADWIANTPPRCCNCTRAGLEGSAEHNAFSRDCPVRRKWDALARSSIAYC